MEFKSSIAAAAFLFLLLATPTPCLMAGLETKEPEVYEIDYRGPETHSYLPPPNRSAGSGRHHNLHHQSDKVASQLHKSKDQIGRRVRRIHG